MGPTGFPEMSVQNYHSTLGNIPASADLTATSYSTRRYCQ